MRITLEFKPRDMWIGVYWRKTLECAIDLEVEIKVTDIWICIIPTLPIHIKKQTVTDMPLQGQHYEYTILDDIGE